MNTSRFFPRSWLINGFVTRLARLVSLVDKELLTLPERLSSPLGSCYSIFCFICMFCRSLFFTLYLFFTIVLSVLRYTDSDYPFGIFKFFEKFYGRHHDLGYRYRVPVSKWPRICSVCRNHNPFFSSFMTYHRVCNKSNTTAVTSLAGTPEFTPNF
jgi:hypothetical protein